MVVLVTKGFHKLFKKRQKTVAGFIAPINFSTSEGSFQMYFDEAPSGDVSSRCVFAVTTNNIQPCTKF